MTLSRGLLIIFTDPHLIFFIFLKHDVDAEPVQCLSEHMSPFPFPHYLFSVNFILYLFGFYVLLDRYLVNTVLIIDAIKWPY